MEAVVPSTGCYSTHHVTIVLFVCVCVFLSHRFPLELCVGWWRCLEEVFEGNEVGCGLLLMSWSHLSSAQPFMGYITKRAHGLSWLSSVGADAERINSAL